MQARKSLQMKSTFGKLLGKSILALGFGKFSFSPRLFHKVEIAMPTI